MHMHLARSLVAVLVCGLFGDPAAAQPRQEGIDMKLESAGFQMRPADTEKKLARLRQFPPRKFVRRTMTGGSYYIYSDPDYCKCAFVGSVKAMQTYRDMNAPPLALGTPIGSGRPSRGDEALWDMQGDVDDTLPDGDDDYINFKF